MPKVTDNFQSSACNLCFINCGIQVQLGGENNREFIKIKGDKDHPTSEGYICNKAARLNFYQNNKDRLLSPMRRCADGSYEQVDWDTALREVAQGLAKVRDNYGGERILSYGGGGQGNHLGGTYGSSVRSALGSIYNGGAISQEKTGLSWVFSRMIGSITHPELHHAEVAMFVGKNPFLSNGMDKARQFLREISKDPKRKLIVMDPRRTETTDYADIHLAVKPGRDAWCLTAIIAHIVQQDWLPMDWLEQHSTGHEKVMSYFQDIPVDDFARFSGVEPDLIRETAEVIAKADSFALEEDIGIQMAPHSTLVTYLNHLACLLTGNYGKPGTMGLSVQLIELIASDVRPVDDQGREISRPQLPVTGAPIVSNLYPGAYLAEEILNDHEHRARALIVESSNPVHSLPESGKLREAMRSLEFSVCIDVAMTETALECDYVLPAATQYEKWEATYFARNFPDNFYHLRPPLLSPAPGTMTEPEIHARIIENLNFFEPGELDSLKQAAKLGFVEYQKVFFEQIGQNPKIAQMLPYVLYRTLGPALPEGHEATAGIWGLCQVFVMKFPEQTARAGFSGATAGTDLYQKIVNSPSGAVISKSTHEESFSRIPHKDNKLQMVMAELLDEVTELRELKPLVDTSEEFPFALMAGQRRAYTANAIIRGDGWVKGKATTALTMHPDDAERLQLPDGATVLLETEINQAAVELAYDERMQPGTMAVPNGQGMSYTKENGEKSAFGVLINDLTSAKHRDKFIGTPLHKFVPARVSLISA